MLSGAVHVGHVIWVSSPSEPPGEGLAGVPSAESSLLPPSRLRRDGEGRCA